MPSARARPRRRRAARRSPRAWRGCCSAASPPCAVCPPPTPRRVCYRTALHVRSHMAPSHMALSLERGSAAPPAPQAPAPWRADPRPRPAAVCAWRQTVYPLTCAHGGRRVRAALARPRGHGRARGSPAHLLRRLRHSQRLLPSGGGGGGGGAACGGVAPPVLVRHGLHARVRDEQRGRAARARRVRGARLRPGRLRLAPARGGHRLLRAPRAAAPRRAAPRRAAPPRAAPRRAALPVRLDEPGQAYTAGLPTPSRHPPRPCARRAARPRCSATWCATRSPPWTRCFA